MLQFITGGAGTGKSTRIGEEMRRLRQAGKTVYYLVPEQYSFEMERRYYADDILVYSMERLADAIFRRCGGLAGAYASDTVQLMLMRETLRDVGNGLSLLQKSAGKPGFAAGMLSLRAELMRAGVDAGALEEAARSLRPAAGEGDALPLKLRDLALIFEGYGAAFSRSFLDPSARLARAVEKAAENGFFDGAYVFVDEYKSFTGVQLQMLAVIIRQAESVSVALCDDPSRQGDALFEGVRETARKLKGIAAKENIPVAPPIQLTEPHRFAAPEIGWFGSQLFKPAPEPFPGPAPGIQCAKLENEYEECFFAAAWIQSAVREKGYRYEEIAVLARDMEARRSGLEAAFDRYDVPYFLDSGRTVESSPVIRCALHLFGIILRPLDREEALMLFKCGLLPVDLEEISAFEEYTYVWDVTGYSFARPFTENPAGFSEREMEERDEEKLARAEKVRQLLVRLHSRLKQALESEGPARGLYRVLEEEGIRAAVQARLDTLIENGDEAEAEDLRLGWDSLMGFLDAAETVRQLRAESGEEMAVSDCIELLRTVAADTPLTPRPQTLDSVLAGDLSQVRVGEKRAVILLGCNEGVFPRAAAPDGMFTSGEREALIALGLPVQGGEAENLIDERFSAYKAVTTPSEQLVLTYAAGDAAGAVMSPSEVVLSLWAAVPGASFSTGRDLGPYFFSQSLSTAFLQAARLPEGAERRTLECLLEADSVWNGRLRKLRHAAARAGETPVSGPVSEALFAPVKDERGEPLMRLSPSQVERYFSCPFAYFCRYGLGIRTPVRAELNPLARGSILHFLFRRALETEGFTALPPEEVHKLTIRILAEYLDTALGGGEEKSGKFLYYFHRLQEAALEILLALQRELGQSAFRVAAAEEPIAPGGEVQPLTVRDPSFTVQVGGKIDRVDEASVDGEQFVRVIDYKTGGKAFKLSEAKEGLNMQMLLYLFAVGESRGRFAGTVPAGILYMPAGPRQLKFGRDEGDALARAGLFKMNGLVLDEEPVLRAMEQVPGSFIEPPGRNAADSRISREGLEELKAGSEELLRRMGAALLAGEVAPAPKESGGKSPCTWCEYKVLCGK